MSHGKLSIKLRKKRLLKDIVIPAGTVFEERIGTTTYYADGDNYDVNFGITKDSSGRLVYGIDRDDIELNEWFEDVREEENGETGIQ